MQPILDFLVADGKFQQYVKPLQYVVVMRLLKQVSFFCPLSWSGKWNLLSMMLNIYLH